MITAKKHVFIAPKERGKKTEYRIEIVRMNYKVLDKETFRLVMKILIFFFWAFWGLSNRKHLDKGVSNLRKALLVFYCISTSS